LRWLGFGIKPRFTVLRRQAARKGRIGEGRMLAGLADRSKNERTDPATLFGIGRHGKC
jgi:hypothetical protein